ncbi:MAG: hydroxymethylglutaryl-CoA lyase, partial [Gammaproteobacteria bacterium]|nr:hydroxymethylglutaryl-CoA lyase [Gammaproteobacteria bacterium]
IEATSFVSPKWIPQLADHKDVYQHISKDASIGYPVLIMNKQGLENALAVEVKEIAVFSTPSEQFSKKNTNRSVAENEEITIELLNIAKKNNIKVRGYISCVLGCPYEGDISPEKVSDLANKLLQWGCYEVSLGDTIGVGTPKKTQILLDSVKEKIPAQNIAVHFHDTFGQALTNIYVALQNDIHIIDCSVAGLGGCPYAKGASGNVATEDVLYFLNGLNIETGISLEKLIQAGQFITNYLNREPRSKVSLAMHL